MNHIHHIKAPRNEAYDRYWYKGQGFYFADDGEQLIGPYSSYEEAQAAFNRYCDMLDSVGGGL
jgi:hypothetical protein